MALGPEIALLAVLAWSYWFFFGEEEEQPTEEPKLLLVRHFNTAPDLVFRQSESDSLSEAKEDAAALKLQASRRGQIARREVNAMKASMPCGGSVTGPAKAAGKQEQRRRPAFNHSNTAPSEVFRKSESKAEALNWAFESHRRAHKLKTHQPAKQDH
jgi:hypothetical protein